MTYTGRKNSKMFFDRRITQTCFFPFLFPIERSGKKLNARSKRSSMLHRARILLFLPVYWMPDKGSCFFFRFVRLSKRMGEKGRHGFCGIQRRYLSSWIGDTFDCLWKSIKERRRLYFWSVRIWLDDNWIEACLEWVNRICERIGFWVIKIIFTNMCKIGLMYIII